MDYSSLTLTELKKTAAYKKLPASIKKKSKSKIQLVKLLEENDSLNTLIKDLKQGKVTLKEQRALLKKYDLPSQKDYLKNLIETYETLSKKV